MAFVGPKSQPLDQPARISNIDIAKHNLCHKRSQPLPTPCANPAKTIGQQPELNRRPVMSIDKQSDISADLQIGPTSLGMVRIYVVGDGFELPLDFDPDEAMEIAEELKGAAQRAAAIQSSKKS